jgi:hypothetical protein
LQQERKHLAMIQSWYEEAVGLGAEGRANVDHSTTCAATPGAALAEPDLSGSSTAATVGDIMPVATPGGKSIPGGDGH